MYVDISWTRISSVAEGTSPVSVVIYPLFTGEVSCVPELAREWADNGKGSWMCNFYGVCYESKCRSGKVWNQDGFRVDSPLKEPPDWGLERTLKHVK